jgi:hypothetical protein
MDDNLKVLRVALYVAGGLVNGKTTSAGRGEDIRHTMERDGLSPARVQDVETMVDAFIGFANSVAERKK